MSNIRTPEEVTAFLKANCFVNRYHAFCARAIIIAKYGRMKELREVGYRYPVNSDVSMDKPIITANDAIKFLTEK